MKGFTLIELLATIVILAIILLIAVPIINNIIESVEKASFESSVKNIVRSGEYTFANGLFKPSRELVYTFEDSKVTGNFPDAKLEFNGEVPQSGNLIIREDGKIAASLFNGKYCAVKDYNDSKVIITNAGIDDCYSEISLPEVTLNGTTPVNIEINAEYTDAGVTAKATTGIEIVNIDKKIYKNEIVVPSVDTSVLGTYKITYTVYEGPKMNYTEREVNIVDTIKPVLTVPLSTSIVIADVNTFDLMAGVSVTDNSLETLTINVSGNLSRIAGSYTITYSVKDSSNNETIVERIINVNDINAPVLTLNGASVINLNMGDSYIELGATSLDDADGDLTSSIIKTGSVNTNTPGTYLITYTSKDSSNNESSITRTVNVIDNVQPTVTFGTNGNATYAKTHSTTVTVDDNVAVQSRYYQWTTSATAPTSGSFSQPFTNGANVTSPAGVSGSYYLWIKAVDTNTNETIVRTNLFNLDNTAPIITMNGTTPVNVTVGGSYTDAGATAIDNIGGNITANIVTTSNINLNVVGSYNVTYNVTDSSGNNAATVTRTVNVTALQIVQIASGGDSTFLLMSDGTVRAAGYNVYGQLGDMTSIHKWLFFKIPNLNNVKQIAAGIYHTVFLMNDGTVKTVGEGSYGKLGNGSTDNNISITTIPGLSNVKQVAAGYDYTIFLMNDGRVKGFGNNEYGQLGVGTGSYYTTLVNIDIDNVVQVSTGQFHTVFLRNNGTVYATGRNSSGQLGDGTTSLYRLNPVYITNDIKSIHTGPNTTMFITNSGVLKATGYNGYGQLGDGSNVNRSVPTTINGISNIKNIAMGSWHTMFLTNDGKVYATGDNTNGQYGMGTITGYSVPTLITPVANVNYIRSGDFHTMFLTTTGYLYTTGRNNYGQLGIGTFGNSNTPNFIVLN